jgi:hypothetical protein
VARDGQHMGLPCIKGRERRCHAAQTDANGHADVLRLAAGAYFLSVQTQTDVFVHLRRPVGDAPATGCVKMMGMTNFIEFSFR